MREFLKGLELDKDTIESIMAEHGKAMTALREEGKSLRKDYEARLAEAGKQIEAFKTMDVDAIKKASEEWKQKAEKAEKDAELKIGAMQFDLALSTALAAAKARNPKAVAALLDRETLKLKDGGIAGLKEQLEAIRKDNGFLFEAEQKPAERSGGAGFSGRQAPDAGDDPSAVMNSLFRGSKGGS